MPIQTPPPPVEYPVKQVPVVINNELPSTSADDLFIQPSATFQDNGTNSSEARSDAENIVSQQVSQSNYQFNNNNDSYATFHSGSKLPVPVWQTNFLYSPKTGEKVITTGLTVPIGGRSKRLIHAQVSLDNVARQASICQGILNNFDIDYELLPALKDCKGFLPKTVAVLPPPPSVVNPLDEITKLKQEMLEYKKLIVQQQNTIQAFQQRLIQMEHQTPVRVGG